jgi:hypothetical protein
MSLLLHGSVEKGRQRRSRHLAVLTYSFVRSARPSGCGLAGRAFLNTPFFGMALSYSHTEQQTRYCNYSIASSFIVASSVYLKKFQAQDMRGRHQHWANDYGVSFPIKDLDTNNGMARKSGRACISQRRGERTLILNRIESLQHYRTSWQ